MARAKDQQTKRPKDQKTGKPAYGSVRGPSGPLVPWSLGLLIFLLVTATFLPTLRNGFISFDDGTYILGNVHVQKGLSWEGLQWAFGATAAGNWHPLTWLSHMLDYQIFGLHPWGHHLTSVLIHALNSTLVFLVFRRMTGAPWRSFFLAMLFGLHPLRVESVAWAAERKDVLSVLFFLLTIWAYVKGQETGVRSQEPGGARSATHGPSEAHASRITHHALLSSIFYLLSASLPSA